VDTTFIYASFTKNLATPDTGKALDLGVLFSGVLFSGNLL
jgi:hypothetical protein